MLTVQPVFFLSLLSILTNQQPQTNKLRQLLDVCSKNTLSSKKKEKQKDIVVQHVRNENKRSRCTNERDLLIKWMNKRVLYLPQ